MNIWAGQVQLPVLRERHFLGQGQLLGVPHLALLQALLLLLDVKLKVPESQQLGKFPALVDLARLQHIDVVRVHDCLHAVGDRQGRQSL